MTIKICFFYAHPQKISGGLYYFYALANEVGKKYDVYVENYKNSEYLSIFKETHSEINFKYVNYEDENEIFDDDTIFFTYLNMVPLVLEKYMNLKKAKILLIDFHILHSKYLVGNLLIQNDKKKINKLFGLLSQTKSVIFQDKSCVLNLNRFSGCKFDEHYVPVFTGVKNVKENTPPIINKKTINIGLVCRLDIDKIYTVINLLDNLYCLNIDKKIRVHIIGDGTSKNKIDIKQYSKKMELIFTSYLYNENLKDYLYKNVDLLINFGIAALDVARLKLPVAIPMMCSKESTENQYYYLFNSKYNILGCTAEDAITCKIKTEPIVKIIEDLYNGNNKKVFGKKCFDYVNKHHSLEQSVKQFLLYLQGSSLTIEDCLSFGFISSAILLFSNYKQTIGGDYNAFLRCIFSIDKCTFKNKICYNVWKCLNKKIYSRKDNSEKKSIYCKIWKHLNKEYLKKNQDILSIDKEKNDINPYIRVSSNLSLKNKIRYKIWKHLTKKILKKGSLSKEYAQTFIKKVRYKIWKHLNKKLLKKGIIKNIQVSKDNSKKIEEHNNILLKKLRKTYMNNHIIRVAFIELYATSIQSGSIFDKMLESDIFDPYWIVCPDVFHSKENFDFQYKRTKETLIAKYGEDRVLDGYDYKNEKFIDYTGRFDLATTCNPYEAAVHKLFKVEYWTKKLLMFYIPYFYMGRCYVTIENLSFDIFSKFWKVFSESEYVKKLAQKHEIVEGRNIIVTGYPKFDRYASIKTISYKRKRVILSPHHTINPVNKLFVGSFFSYAGDLQNLPKKFPEIDFIFRPHPFWSEQVNCYWGKERTQEWLDELLSNPNVTYSTEGDYQELFVNSDALIHDCGSFSAEYLCTGHPCAYWFKKTADYNKIHTEFGHKCIDNHYLIKNKKDLFDFIKNVVINGNDPKKEARDKFAKEELMLNYPHVTDTIMDILTKEITGEKA